MKTEEQAAMIYTAILECFREENELPLHMKLEDLKETFFEAGVFALKLLYTKITHEELDVLDFIGVLNKVCVQGLLDCQKGKVD